MKKKIVRMKLAALALLATLGLAAPAAAQVSQFGQPTYLLGLTNSPVLATTTFNVYVPPISLSITATNASTVITNLIGNTVTVNGTNSLSFATTFVYYAATMGTNFSTNWPGYYLTVTNYTYGVAIPQAGGTNTAYVK